MMLKKLFLGLILTFITLFVGVQLAQAQTDGSLQFVMPSSRWSSTEVAVLNAAEQPQIFIQSHNITGLGTFVLYKVEQPDLLNYLLYKRTDDANFGSSSITKAIRFRKDDYPVIARFEQEVKATTNNRNHKNIVDLPITGTGVWYLEGTVAGKTIHTMILRSNLSGLVHKGDNQNIYWVQDSNYERVSDASIQLFNSENTLTTLKELKTNSDGLAVDSFNDALDFVVVSKGSDFTIIPVNLFSLSYRPEKNAYYSSFAQRQPGSKSFIFTDRFLYQPGDTVHFKAIIRQDDDAEYSIQSKVYNVSLGSYEESIWQQDLPLSELGTLEGSMTIPADYEAEYLSLNVQVNGTYLTTTGIQVARFRKPDATLAARTDKLLYLPGEKIKVKVQGSLFLGQPIRNQEFRYKVYQNEAHPYVQGEYTKIKINQGLESYQAQEVPLYEGKLTFDKKGEAELELPAQNKTGFRQFWQFHFEYLDAAGGATNKAIQILLQPGDFVIEVDGDTHRYSNGTEQLFPLVLNKNKADADLAKVLVKAKLFQGNGSGYTLVNDDLTVITDSYGKAQLPFTPTTSTNYKFEFEAADRTGNTIKGLETFYVNDKDDPQAPVDIFTISTDKNEYEVGDIAKVSIQTKPEVKTVFVSLGRVYSRDFRVLTVENGRAYFEFPVIEKYQPNFFIQVTSFWGDEIRQQEQKVIVNTYDKNITVSIKPDQTTYGPGETAIFDLTATDGKGRPVQTDLAFWVFDKALLELHGVYFGGIFDRFWDERWFSIPTNFSYQGISGSGSEGGGGCFAPDTLITMADGSLKRIDQVTVGEEIKTFADQESQDLVTATVNQAYSVDVAGYLIVNGYLKITPEHKLLVNGVWKTAGEMAKGDSVRLSNGTTEIVSSLEWVRGKFTVYNLHISKFHTFFANGVYVHNEKGDVRSVFKDTAYWNPHVSTNQDGKAQLTVVLPDNLTTWVAAAVAANFKTQVGEGQAEFKVTKDIVVRPIFPLFLRAGDRISLSALVQNFSTEAHKFMVSIIFSAGKVTQPEQSVSVASEEMEEVVWLTEVGAVPAGVVTQASLQVKAESKDNVSLVDDVTQKIPLYEYGSVQTSYQSAVVSTQAVESLLPIIINEGTDQERTSGQLLLATTEYPSLEKDLDQLLQQANGGTQAAAEALVAASIVKEYGTELGLSSTLKQSVNLAVERASKSLTDSQQPSGVWYTTNERIDYETTRLAVEALVLAEQAGLEIPRTTLSKAVDYYLNQQPTLWSEQVEQQYIFSLLEGDNYSRVKLDLNQTYDPQLRAMAALANVRQGFVNSTEESKLLLSLAKETPTQMAWLSEGYDRKWANVHAPTTWAVRALVALDTELEKSNKALKYLYRNQERRWASPSQLLTLATVEYLKASNHLVPNYSYRVLLGDSLLSSGSVSPANQKIAPVLLTAEQLINQSQLKVEKTGGGYLYSQLQVSEFYTTRELAAKNQNLQVERRYLSTKAEGEPTQVGDLVLVEFTVSGLGTGERAVDIIDYVPAGLVIIDESLNNGNFDPNDSSNLNGTADNWHTQQITDQGMKLQFSTLFSDTGTYSYKARVVSEGVFDAPPAVVSLSGDPSIWGSTTADQLQIDGKNVLEKSSSYNKNLTWVNPNQSSLWSQFKKVMPAVTLGGLLVTTGLSYWYRTALWTLYQQLKTKFIP